jgi:fatty acid omega-hydroxylase
MTYHSLKGLASDVEFNRQQADHENYPSALPQLISFDDFPSSSSVMDIHVGVSSVRSELMFPFSQNYNLSALSDLMSLAVPSSSNAVEGPLEASERKCKFSISFHLPVMCEDNCFIFNLLPSCDCF